MQKTKRTTTVSSNYSRSCEHCRESVGSYDSGDLGPSINHFIEEHGYQLLHVGQQTERTSEGELWHSTVAVLGHDNPPALAPTPQIDLSLIPRPDYKAQDS